MLAPKKFHDEVYLPWCFVKENEVVGGAYIYAWECGGKGKEPKQFPSKNNPIQAFATGMCLFGDDLIGIDQFKQLHPLTNSKNNLEGKTICAIQESKEKHPYTNLTQGMLQNLLPLIKACAAKDSKIYFHLPVPEYIVYGIKMRVYGQMSKDIFYEYLKLVIAHGKEVKNAIKQIADAFNIYIEFTSPLDILNLDHTSKIEELFSELPTVSKISEQNKLAEQKLVQTMIKILCASTHVCGHIWKIYAKQTNELHLLDLNYASYAVHVAMTASMHKSENICLLDMASEVLIGKAYSKYFAALFGSILCLHWLPPIFLHDNKYNEIYLCGDYKGAVNSVLEHTMKKCPLQTGKYVYNALKWNSLFSVNKLSAMPSQIKKLIYEYDCGETEMPNSSDLVKVAETEIDRLSL